MTDETLQTLPVDILPEEAGVRVQRMEPSLLYRGARIDLGMLTDEAVSQALLEQLTGRSSIQHVINPLPVSQRSSGRVTVDYLCRTGPESYEVVAQEAGIRIDTRYIDQIEHPHNVKVRRMQVDHLVYDDALMFAHITLSGQQLLARHRVAEKAAQLVRLKARYVGLGNFCDLVMVKLMRQYPRERCWLDRNEVFSKLFQDHSINQFAQPVAVMPSDTVLGHQEAIYVRIKPKGLDRWLKRNQSRFYTGTAQAQRLLDDLDVELAAQERDAAVEIEENNKAIILASQEREAVEVPLWEETIDDPELEQQMDTDPHDQAIAAIKQHEEDF